MKFKKFIKECRENDVLKNLSIYIVSSWVLLQVVALMAQTLEFSNSVVAYLLLLLLICFPLYIYWVWKYQLADTIKKEPLLDKEGVPIPGKFAKSPFQKIYFSFLTIISIIAIGISLFIVRKNFIKDINLIEVNGEDKIAVLKFDNNTGDDKYNIAGKMAADWIIHGITQNKVAQVISPEIIDDYSKILEASINTSDKNNALTDYLKPSKIISGEFFLNKNRLLVLCSITDEIMNKTLISFEAVECDPNSPLDCFEAIKQRVLGYLITEDKKILSLQESPPSFEAYKFLNDAKIQDENDNQKEYLRLLDKAIETDSTYFEPKVTKFMYYYNIGQYEIADSLLNKLSRITSTYSRQKILLNLYEALQKGDNKKAYEYQKIEYNITPFHLETNASMMTLALQLVNKPQEIDSIYKEINMEDWDTSKCNFCIERYKIMAMAQIELKKYKEAINLLEDFGGEQGNLVLKKILLRAYIRSGDYPNADDLLSGLTLKTEGREWMNVYLFTAKEFLLIGKKDLAQIYLDRVIKATEETNDKLIKLKGECLFYKEDYENAEKLFEAILKEEPNLISYMALLAVVYQKNGKIAAAESQITALENLNTKFRYGKVDYALAQYYATMSDEDKTLRYLMKALVAGHWFETSTFQSDPFFTPYFETDGFKRILTFLH